MTRLDRNAIRKLAVGKRISRGRVIAERTAAGVRFSVNVMVDGRRVHRHGFGSLTASREFLEQAKSHARHGRLNLPKGRKLVLTFGGGADDYVKRLEQSGGKNLPIKRRQLRMYLLPYFGAMRLDAITAFTIDKYKKRRLYEGTAAATVNRELAILSHLFTKAVEWCWVDYVPVKPKKLAQSAGRIIALTDDECDVLMMAALASADPDLWLFVAFGLNTAMPHSEIMAARWDQLDLPNRRLFIPDAKAGYSHRRTRTAQPSKGAHGSAVPRGRKDGRSRSRDSHAARHAAYGHHEAGTGPGSIFRPCRGSAVIRRWRWCCATRTSMAAILTMRSGPSAERSRNRPRTEPKTRLYQNYTKPLRATLPEGAPEGGN